MNTETLELGPVWMTAPEEHMTLAYDSYMLHGPWGIRVVAHDGATLHAQPFAGIVECLGKCGTTVYARHCTHGTIKLDMVTGAWSVMGTLALYKQLFCAVLPDVYSCEVNDTDFCIYEGARCLRRLSCKHPCLDDMIWRGRTLYYSRNDRIWTIEV